MVSVEPKKSVYDDLDDDDLDELVGRTMDEFHTPGLAVIIARGNMTYAKGYGVSDIAQTMPVTPHTLFPVASMTKSFTSALAAALVESNEHPAIDWETPLSKMLPEDFVLDQTSANGQWATNTVTMKDALSHRTGLPRHDLIWTNGNKTNVDIVRSLRHVPLHRQPRVEWEYSNNPYTIVSRVVEKHLNAPLRDLLTKDIFEPLGMHATSYDIQDVQKFAEQTDNVSMSRGYIWDKKAQDFEVVPWTDLPPSRGSNGIISNVLDFQHWVRNLMNPTKLSPALTESVVKAMRVPQMLVHEDFGRPWTGPKAYGLGLFSAVYQGREVLFHSGATTGYMSLMMMVPPTSSEIAAGKTDGGWAVVTMQNAFSLAQDVIAWHLLDQHLDTPECERFDMAQKARDQQAEAEKSMQPDVVVERLYGSAARDFYVAPVLPLKAYEGVYGHPAYGAFNVSLTLGDSVPERPTEIESDERLTLYMQPARGGYCAMWYKLYHVSGEWWWARKRMGAGDWMTTTAHKVRFVVGASGHVTNLRFQAEASMADFLADFTNIDEVLEKC